MSQNTLLLVKLIFSLKKCQLCSIFGGFTIKKHENYHFRSQKVPSVSNGEQRGPLMIPKLIET